VGSTVCDLGLALEVDDPGYGSRHALAETFVGQLGRSRRGGKMFAALRRLICNVGDAQPNCQGSTLPVEEQASRRSDGQKAVTLMLTQSAWTHRRAETTSLEPHGETRQRISWDFTVDPSLTIKASGERIAVPLATLVKQPLKRLDVTDASGGSLSIWGREDNGRLAVEALESGLIGILRRGVSEQERAILRDIVFAADYESAAPSLQALDVPGHEVGYRRLVGGRPPSAVWRRRVL
jgi:hypothetical protein